MSVVGIIKSRKQHLGIPKAREVADTHGVKHANQVIALVLYHPRMKALDRAVNRLTFFVKALVT